MENFNNMNSFNNDQQNIKEKNMYLLHLDGVRIFILSAILIAIIAVTFLIGINFKEKDEKKENIFSAKSENIFEKNNSDNKKSIDDLFEDSETEQIVKEENNINLNEKNSEINNKQALNTEPATEPIKKDILTTDEVKKIIPAKTKKNVKTIKTHHKKIVKRKKHNKTKPVAAVVPVRKKRIKITNKVSKKGYSIQVAAYDRKFKAKKEENRLKSHNYNAYTDKANVKGRNYYRVLIGPLGSKRKALNLLNKIQENPRYENSYVIFQ